MGERAVDELLEVLDGRFASNHRFTHTRTRLAHAYCKARSDNSVNFRPDYTIVRICDCPSVRLRKARRACPALDQQICAVCCGTKRLTEIQCPPTASISRRPANIRRQSSCASSSTTSTLLVALHARSQRAAVATVSRDRQLSRRLQAAGVPALIDDDVGEAAGALAATFETASRGVIYEHRPASLPAERLIDASETMLAEAGPGGGTAFERDAAVVLRRVEQTARAAHADEPRQPPRLSRSARPNGSPAQADGARGARQATRRTRRA